MSRRAVESVPRPWCEGPSRRSIAGPSVSLAYLEAGPTLRSHRMARSPSPKPLKISFRDELPSKNDRGRPPRIRNIVERVGMEQHEIGLLSDRDGALRRGTAKKFGRCTCGGVQRLGR